ncbi:MAG TPA: HlyD family efflux transporter periplasmic adaptor subunit, partial [Planctomycetota bacterium]|nr:HlyD family efflux transporter periplasmic adaptor subunit [Planctomycetota bacterium]
MPADSATHDLAKLRIERDRHDVGPRRRSRTPAVLVLLILVGAALAVWWFAFRDRLPEVATTRVVEVTPTEGNAVLTASGYVVAQRKVILGAKSPRRLVERLAGEGDRVQEGQIVARLDHRDVDGQLAQAKAAVVAAEAVAARADAAVMRAERNLEGARAVAGEAEAKRASDEKERDRLHQLGEGGGVDRRSIDLADAALLQSSAAATATKARIASAEADLEWTKRDLAAARADVKVKEADIEVASSAVEDTIIRAPFAGVVLLKQAEIGESVSPGVVSGQVTSGSIFQIADFDTLEAEVDVNEANLSRVRDGQPAAIQVDAIPERAFAGEVRLLMPGANRQKATVAAKVRFLEK